MSTGALQQDLLVESGAAWKQEASARLQAHRSRRPGHRHQPVEPEEAPSRVGRKARIAQSVLERYAQAPSYTQYLDQIAAEAHPGTSPADAAEAIPAAQLSPEPVGQDIVPLTIFDAADDQAPLPADPVLRAGELTIALPADLPSLPEFAAFARNRASHTGLPPENFLEEATVEPELAIPANLIEFPRVLVAPRKVRPRLAEGPLREEAMERAESRPVAETTGQLRIFEVEEVVVPAPASVAPALPEAPAAAPEWHHIRLDARPVPIARPHAQGAALDAAPTQFDLPLSVASLSRRGMAALVDTSLIAIGYLGLVAAFVSVLPVRPSGRAGEITAAAVFAACFAAYHWLFASYGGATPGMRYARIALCSFRDENPSRREVRWRFAAFLLSLGTMGLGLLWSVVDDDRLGWHDRISRTYQRCY